MSQKFVKVGHGYIGQSNYWEKGTNKPRYYGRITVDGVDIELAGWDKEKDGRTYVSLQVNKAEEDQVPPLNEPLGPTLMPPGTPGPSVGPRQTPDPIVPSVADDNGPSIPGMPTDNDVPF